MSLAQMRRAPTHPGTMLAEFLRDSDVSQAEAARRLGVGRAQLSHLRVGRRPMTMELCVKVAALFDMTPEFWATLQMRYDLWHAMREHAAAAKRVEKIAPAA